MALSLCGHGKTHVAGIAAGLNIHIQGGGPASGVAKGASIWAIQVFTRNGSGVGAFDFDIIRGLDHVVENMNNLPGDLKVDFYNNEVLEQDQLRLRAIPIQRKPAIDIIKERRAPLGRLLWKRLLYQ